MEEIELINKAEEELKRLRELTILQRMYIELLVNEINSMIEIAHGHGWRSERIEEGKLLREKIALLEK